ncbi:MAG: GntR family transcriptional regulator [Gammaproteobacteria bacterium]
MPGLTPTPLRFQPAVPEQIADHLQAQIVRGELAAGTRIAEARVTEALGVSRGPVREALRILVSRHLVVIEPRRGARVTPFGLTDVQALYDLHRELLTLLALRVSELLDETMLATLATFRADVREAAGQGDALALLKRCDAFMDGACELIGNVYLRDTLGRLAPAFDRAHYLALATAEDQTRLLGDFLDALMAAVIGRERDRIRELVANYARGQVRAIAAVLAV